MKRILPFFGTLLFVALMLAIQMPAKAQMPMPGNQEVFVHEAREVDQTELEAEAPQPAPQPEGSKLSLLLILLICSASVLVAYDVVHYRDHAPRRTPRRTEPTTREGSTALFVDGTQAKAWRGNAWEGMGVARFVVFDLSALVLLVALPLILVCCGVDTTTSHAWSVVLSLVLYLTLICWAHNTRTLQAARKRAVQSVCPQYIYTSAMHFGTTRVLNICCFWLSWFYLREYRNALKEHTIGVCPQCSKPLSSTDGYRYTPQQEREQALNVIVRQAYVCSGGHTVVVEDMGKYYEKYRRCDQCGTHALKVVKSKVIVKPTESSEGRKEVLLHCEYCNSDQTLEESVPRKLSHRIRKQDVSAEAPIQ